MSFEKEGESKRRINSKKKKSLLRKKEKNPIIIQMLSHTKNTKQSK